uniref:G protein-coupled receptor n=1 Tax=Haemonchus contortus TaxID=6289 RepID=A0A7I4YPZ1_HAECO
VELVSWYFTSVLVFLIGLNRLAILTRGSIHSLFAERKNVLWFSLMLFVLSALVGIISSGLMESLRELSGTETASHFLLAITEICTRVDYFFAALPVCSCLFYIAAFKKVRSMRRPSMAIITMDKAESSILKQGFLICIFYTIPELMLLISQFGLQIGIAKIISVKLLQTIFSPATE